KSDRRKTVGLRAQQRVMGLRPGAQRRKKALVGELGQCLAPVVTDRSGFRRGVAGSACDEQGQMRREVVAAASLEFSKQVGRPVGAVIFETVAEHGVWRLIGKGGHQAVTDGAKMRGDRGGIVVVENEA